MKLVLLAGVAGFLVLTTGKGNRRAVVRLRSIPSRSALNSILGDLNQEIINGSTVSSPASGFTLYTPKPTVFSGASTAIPALVGFTPTFSGGQETDGLANLLKVSREGVPFYSSTANLNYAANGVARAAGVNSSVPSLDGHAVTAARWNEHYLLAPTNNFTSPDWILTTSTGSNPTTFTPGIKSSGSTPVTGRYAYAIYNEGGLLDMNVAGYPSGMTTAQSSYKSLQSFADLTQLGLTQTQIDQIVGWRNSATAQPNGSFPNYTFDSAAANRYYNAVLSNTNGFLAPLSANGSSDQQFTSRQQLIGLTQSLSIDPSVLQYLGTFSRSLEQPTVSPDPNRPLIINPGTLPPPLGSEGSYLGNNDQAGADNSVNPAFLNVRVATPFTRRNGTTAVVGEPLVKTRFALSNLAMVAYNATNTGSAGDPIYDRFGLSRSNPSNPWVYNHGQNYIMPLSQVAAAGREPDFAELLKATITTGSLAKGAPNFQVPGGDNFQYVIDTSVDAQVLQIMANLIDQQDADSYPTWIQLGSKNIYGTEDLPGIYRMQEMSVVEQLPANETSSSFGTVTINGTTNAGGNRQVTLSRQWSFPAGVESSTTVAYTVSIPSGSSILLKNAKTTFTPVAMGNEGKVAYMYVLQVWNPHDPNAATTNPAITALRPSQFRIVAETKNPAGQNPWSIGFGTTMTGSSTGSATTFSNFLKRSDNTFSPANYYWPISPCAVLDKNSTGSGFTFSDAGGALYREPTMLWNNTSAGPCYCRRCWSQWIGEA